jgi:hypothetical protein
MKFEQFVQQADIFYNDNQPHMRYGQSVMNMLYQSRPDLYEKIKGTDFDCFYDDSTVPLTLNNLETRWETTY